MERKIPWSEPEIGEEEVNAVRDIVKSTWMSQGKETKRFENELAEYLGCKHVIAVNNGTSALIAALMAHGIKEGDEVIVPSFTFISSINAISAVGATPILADIDEKTWNTDIGLIKVKLTPKTKAIMPVDIAGMPIDIDSITEFAKENNLIIIEDAAEALGAEYKGKKIGSFGHTAIFSFHVAKLITTIEGGCIATNDDEIADRCRKIRNHGMEGRYNYTMFGLNFRTTDMQSAMGRVQLKKIGKFIQKRQRIVKIYREVLGDLVKYQELPDYVTAHPYMIFGVLIDPDRRDSINMRLNDLGIETRMWPPINKSMYHSKIFKEYTPNADKVAASLINLPIGNNMGDEDINYVAESLKSILK